MATRSSRFSELTAIDSRKSISSPRCSRSRRPRSWLEDGYPSCHRTRDSKEGRIRLNANASYYLKPA